MKNIILILTVLSAIAFGQGEFGQKPGSLINPFYYYNALSFFSDDSSLSRLDLYIQVPYVQLTFVKDGDKFSSSFEVTASVYDNNDAIVTEKIWSEKITLKSYSETISNSSYNLSLRTFNLKHGTYKLKISVVNRESNKSGNSETPITIRNFRQFPFSTSDIMLINRLDETNGVKQITPNVSRNVVFNNDGFFVYFEFYNFSTDSLFDILCNVENKSGELVYQNLNTFDFKPNKNPVFLKISKKDFPLGDYLITITSTRNKDTNSVYKVSRSFYSKWIGVPQNVKDLDKALDQLIYITDREKIEVIKSNKDPQEKLNKFLEFWKSKDPSPNTSENELMEEYYSRIDYSNKNFGNFLEGYKTDMGMVFVVLGPPDNIDRYPFNYDSPAHEIWHYYRLNKSFVFVDNSGFGDYRLLNRDYTEFYRYR